MLQVVDRLIDLLELVPMGHQVIQFKFSVAVPTNEDWEIAVRTAIPAARTGKRSVADKQARVENRFCVWRRNPDEQRRTASIHTRIPGAHGAKNLFLRLR
jgi:hypothetical protein